MTALAVSYRFSIDEFNRMAEMGFSREDDRVEPTGGRVLRMSAIGDRHDNTVNRITSLFGASTAVSPIAPLTFADLTVAVSGVIG